MAKLFCDTDCELWYTHAEECGIEVIRMPYAIDGEETFADLGETFNAKEFFDRMRAGSRAITSALNEEIYYDTFKPYFEKGEDILYIAFSSKLSGTFASLDLAIARLHEEYPTVKFRRFDTLNICMGAGILVYLGAKYFNAHGGDIDATYAYLESIVNKVAVYFVVEDMKYLARGGRISPAKAKIANLMNIKPVLTVKEDGTLAVGSKQNGLKK
ncbi:MAG: DegV family EDD domain-containing protein, partial [Clostridia bacterium]|nr:DegV family EDD domain-containing protein [Clostridia bacterium]